MRRALTALAVVLALVGAGFLVYPFVTHLWAALKQDGLSGDLAAAAEDYRAGKIKAGEPLTRLEIPRLGVDVVVVEGTSLAALRAGAGHYPETALPGMRGNVAIAGHRTTWGRPFNRMDELTKGDRIILSTPIGRHVYNVTGSAFVVRPDDWSVIHDFPKRASLLTLTSCHPEGSADYRIVVRARLAGSSGAIAASGAAA